MRTPTDCNLPRSSRYSHNRRNAACLRVLWTRDEHYLVQHTGMQMSCQ